MKKTYIQSVDSAFVTYISRSSLHSGTLFGAALITLLPEWIEALDAYKDIIHGLILVLILLFCPRGWLPALPKRCVRALRWDAIMFNGSEKSQKFVLGLIPRHCGVSSCKPHS